MIVACLVTGCSPPVDNRQAPPDSTVTVGQHTVDLPAVQCVRSQSYLTVTGHHEQSVVTMGLDIHAAEPRIDWVKLRDVGGFTGDVWRAGVGDAAVLSRGRGYIATGSAYGVFASRPADLGVHAPFRIEAWC